MRPLPRPMRPPRGRCRAGDQGITAVEFTGWLPLLLVVALTGVQLGLMGYAALQAGSAARAAARVSSQHEIEDRYAAAGRAAVSDWISVSLDRSRCGDETTVTATVTVPSVLPFLSGLGTIDRSVTMPCD